MASVYCFSRVQASDFDLGDSYFPHFKAGLMSRRQGGAGAAGVMMAMNEVRSSGLLTRS
jgi:hypothetical protein